MENSLNRGGNQAFPDTGPPCEAGSVSKNPCFDFVNGHAETHAIGRLRERFRNECRRAAGLLIEVNEHEPEPAKLSATVVAPKALNDEVAPPLPSHCSKLPATVADESTNNGLVKIALYSSAYLHRRVRCQRLPGVKGELTGFCRPRLGQHHFGQWDTAINQLTEFGDINHSPDLRSLAAWLEYEHLVQPDASIA